MYFVICVCLCFFFHAEDGILDARVFRGVGNVYMRRVCVCVCVCVWCVCGVCGVCGVVCCVCVCGCVCVCCLLYKYDGVDDFLCVDLGGRSIREKNH